MGVKAVVFDIGGVVLDESREKPWEILEKKFGIDSVEFRDFVLRNLQRSYSGKINGKEFFELAKKELDIEADVSELVSAWLDARRKTTRVKQEVWNLVEKLKKSYAVASLTDTTELNDIVRNEFGVYGLFDFNVKSVQAGFWKPQTEIYNILLSRLLEKGISASETVFIDDREENLVPARGLGMKTILFENFEKLKMDLKNFEVKI